MARASGLAADGLITGEFSHKQSGVRYRLYQQDDRTWMSYEREKESGFRGQRELLYFIGSGVKGRSYLFSVQGCKPISRLEGPPLTARITHRNIPTD